MLDQLKAEEKKNIILIHAVFDIFTYVHIMFSGNRGRFEMNEEMGFIDKLNYHIQNF